MKELLSPMARAMHRRPLCAVAWLLSCLWCAVAAAQALPALPQSTLREPWVLHLAAIESLATRIEGTGPAQREALADALATLQVSLGEYETRCDQVIDRLIGDANFRYAATEVSAELGQQVADIGAQLATVYALLGVQSSAAVGEAQASLDELRRLLDAKTYFERDVLAGLTSRPLTVELATRWWNGEERAIALKKRVGALREVLEGMPSSAR